MISAAPISESEYEASLQLGQVKHALKTAVACSLSTVLSYALHLPNGELGPVFAFLVMALGMPSPRINWLLTQIAIVISATASALIVVALRDALFLYLAMTLLWIFLCVLFSSRFPLPGTLAAMVSALGIFVFLQSSLGDTLNFYVAYAVNWFAAGACVVIVDSLVWPFTTQKVFVRRLATVYAHLERECRQAAQSLRSDESRPAHESPDEWAPFRPLRQMLAPELRRARDTINPFARIILACRALNLRLWFLNRVIVPKVTVAASSEARHELTSVMDRSADHLHDLLEGALHRAQVPLVEASLLSELNSGRWKAMGTDALLSHGIHVSIVCRLMQDLQTATESHNALIASFHKELKGELITLSPVTTGKTLLNNQSLRAATKLVVIILLLLLEEAWLRFPGGSQVAFFATFFASTGNIGRQNKTDLVGLVGLLGGFTYGVVAAFITSRIPHFPLLLALVFLGEFLASIAYQRLPRFSAAGLQAGLAIPFAYLATTGPEWGSFAAVRTRFAGLVVAGFTALIVHAYLWPVLPMRQLRSSIATALRATAASLTQLFSSPRSAWLGAPQSLSEALIRAPDLLDDARYLNGAEQAYPAYRGLLNALQDIDANLEYIHFLVELEGEHSLRQRFFEVIGDYAEQAQGNLELVSRQFEPPAYRAAAIQTLHWHPSVSRRWENASREIRPQADSGIDPWRPAVIASCLDLIAHAVGQISIAAREINLSNQNS